jgi:tRNA threonylcarbamoyladenosine biosynthesis protein TsaE
MEKEAETFISHSADQTIEFGRRFGRKLHGGNVIGLRGDLGAGKTTMVKGIAEAFGIEQHRVHSPTFSLIHEYEGRLPIYHMDFYRLGDVNEAIEIGTEEYLYGDGICVIEWAEKIRAILPSQIIRITLENRGSKLRQINITKKGL